MRTNPLARAAALLALVALSAAWLTAARATTPPATPQPDIVAQRGAAAQARASWREQARLARQGGAPLAAAPAVSIGPGDRGEEAIILSGGGASATLHDVRDGLAALGRADLLSEVIDSGQHIWTLNRSLLVKAGVTLRISGGALGASENAQVDWLRLFSNPGPTGTLDYSKFASLRARDATVLVSYSKITSWDTISNQLDTTYADGRAYIVVRGVAELTIDHSELSYLGSPDGESYGVSWRDPGTSADPKRTAVTGRVADSRFSHNYYGVYTFQAQNMEFLRNTFADNVQYGFDPHDFTHDVLVQGNIAEGNGNHGFIISRGCNKFTFLSNISRYNKVTASSRNPSAHGFMLDAGAPSAEDPQAPSLNNTYENNVAYGNDGYGFRVLLSNNNTIRNNTFYSNRLGVTLENGSTGNQIVGNQILSSTGVLSNGVLSQGYGITTSGGADGNTLTGNTVRANANIGIYLHVGSSIVQNNIVENNGGDGIAVQPESSSSALTEGPADDYVLPQRMGVAATPAATTPPNNNQISGNIVRGNAVNGLTIKGAVGTQVKSNTFSTNAADGISITAGTSDALLEANTVGGNTFYGIELYGSGVTRNTMTRNGVAGNGAGGISVRNASNGGITAPVLAAFGGNTLTGTARPNALVEIFSDAGSQAAIYEGAVRANGAGSFSFTFAAQPRGAFVTTTATDGANTSALSAPLAVQPSALPTLTPSATATSAPTATPTIPSAPTANATAVPAPRATATPIPGGRRVLLPVVRR